MPKSASIDTGVAGGGSLGARDCNSLLPDKHKKHTKSSSAYGAPEAAAILPQATVAARKLCTPFAAAPEAALESMPRSTPQSASLITRSKPSARASHRHNLFCVLLRFALTQKHYQMGIPPKAGVAGVLGAQVVKSGINEELGANVFLLLLRLLLLR